MHAWVNCIAYACQYNKESINIRNHVPLIVIRYNQKVAAKIIVFSTLETKCEKCTIECIQDEKKSLKHRHKPTELEI